MKSLIVSNTCQRLIDLHVGVKDQPSGGAWKLLLRRAYGDRNVLVVVILTKSKPAGGLAVGRPIGRMLISIMHVLGVVSPRVLRGYTARVLRRGAHRSFRLRRRRVARARTAVAGRPHQRACPRRVGTAARQPDGRSCRTGSSARSPGLRRIQRTRRRRRCGDRRRPPRAAAGGGHHHAHARRRIDAGCAGGRHVDPHGPGPRLHGVAGTWS